MAVCVCVEYWLLYQSYTILKILIMLLFPWFYSIILLILLAVGYFFNWSIAISDTFFLLISSIALLPLLLVFYTFVERLSHKEYKADKENTEVFVYTDSKNSHISKLQIILIVSTVFVGIILVGVFHVSIMTLVFMVSILLGIILGIDSRYFFSGALFTLVVTIAALIYSRQAAAESASIFVYLALVAGVVVELVWPYWSTSRSKFNLGKSLLPQWVVTEYMNSLKEYSYSMLIFFACIIPIALFFQKYMGFSISNSMETTIFWGCMLFLGAYIAIAHPSIEDIFHSKILNSSFSYEVIASIAGILVYITFFGKSISLASVLAVISIVCMSVIIWEGILYLQRYVRNY